MNEYFWDGVPVLFPRFSSCFGCAHFVPWVAKRESRDADVKASFFLLCFRRAKVLAEEARGTGVKM